MPLFGSKHNDNTTATDNTTMGGGRHHMNPIADNTHGFPTTRTGATAGYATGATGGGQGYSSTSGNPGPTNTFAPDQYSQQPARGPFSGGNDGAYAGTAGATGLGGGYQDIGQQGGIPPTGAITHDHALGTGTGVQGTGTGTTGCGGGGAGQRLTGEAERTIGILVGSTALQEKGAQKEREAGAAKLQGRELAEAERLEAEALMRRERAVGHGAHPAKSALGGGGAGAQGPYN